jgi:hypothetical protein
VGGAFLLITAIVGWATLTSMKPSESEAAPPAAAGTSSPQSTPSRSPSAGATMTAPATATGPAPPATTPAPVVPRPAPVTTTVTIPPATTPPASPGPGQALVPDVIAQYEIAADYIVRSAMLEPEFTYVYDPIKCYVIEQNPPAGTLVPWHARVVMKVARYSTICQPV